MPGERVSPRTTRRAGEQESLIAAALGVGSLLCGTIAIWEWFCLINNKNTLLAAFSFIREGGVGGKRTELWLITVTRFKCYGR